MKKPKTLAERMVYSDVGKGSCRLKDSNGKTFTIENYAYVFTWSRFFVTSIDEERIVHTRMKFPLQSLSIIRMYGTPKDLSVRLSRFSQPILHAREK